MGITLPASQHVFLFVAASLQERPCEGKNFRHLIALVFLQGSSNQQEKYWSMVNESGPRQAVVNAC